MLNEKISEVISPSSKSLRRILLIHTGNMLRVALYDNGKEELIYILMIFDPGEQYLLIKLCDFKVVSELMYTHIYVEILYSR